MTEKTGFSYFIRRKLVESGWLSRRVKVEADAPSYWDTRSTHSWTELQYHLHQIFKSFVHWIHYHVWGRWAEGGQSRLTANELLPGFMETADSQAWLEFDNLHQVWTAHLDYTHHSLGCHLVIVNEESTSIMKQILAAGQPGAPPAE